MDGEITVMGKGDDLLASGAQALVNPVDCTGAQGKGLAAAFKRQFPKECAAYRAWTQQGMMKPGMIWSKSAEEARTIIFFATKDHWRNASQLDWIDAGLKAMEARVRALQLASIAIPALGCGEGGLDRRVVWPRIIMSARRMRQKNPEIHVFLYPPHEG